MLAQQIKSKIAIKVYVYTICIVYVQLANYVYVSDLLYIANALNLQ